ncbi:hypothetical protein C2845_PM17G04640 [Panicum miliaceum]|uniref:Uncharacterized protein n=1 Tax=Panicum miliaceum TaxID=4540 RepID=A0A3L6Q1M9_PANMI|nr:hypothetical protein C2845_PM17G04640 [Panicum miliaceum]
MKGLALIVPLTENEKDLEINNERREKAGRWSLHWCGDEVLAAATAASISAVGRPRAGTRCRRRRRRWRPAPQQHYQRPQHQAALQVPPHFALPYHAVTNAVAPWLARSRSVTPARGDYFGVASLGLGGAAGSGAAPPLRAPGHDPRRGPFPQRTATAPPSDCMEGVSCMIWPATASPPTPDTATIGSRQPRQRQIWAREASPPATATCRLHRRRRWRRSQISTSVDDRLTSTRLQVPALRP